MIERNFDLFLNAGKALPLLINVNQYDHGEKWIFTLYNDDGTQYIPSTGAIVGVKADGFGIINSGSIEDGKVVIMETEQMTAAVGKATFELMIDSQTHGTANFNVLVEAKPGNNATYSDSDVSLIQEAVDATSPLPTGGTVGQVLTKTAQGSAWSDAGTPTQAQVAEAVSDWADEHITVETGVVIDNSLSVAGAAADSAKVGSEISELKSQIAQGGVLSEDFKTALENLVSHILLWDDGDGAEYVQALHDAMNPPANLTSISAVYTQSGTVFNVDTLDSLKSDLVVTAHYSNLTTRTVTGYSLSGSLTVGTSTITVSYQGKTTTFNVTVSDFMLNDVLTLDGILNTRNGHDTSAVTWEDLSGNENDFAKASGASNVLWGDDYAGFDATNRVLGLDENLFGSASAFSIELVLDITGNGSRNTSGTYYGVIFSNRAWSENDNGFRANSYNLGMSSQYAGANTGFTSLSGLIKHVVWVFDGTNITRYVNGEATSPVSKTFPSGTTLSTWRIGGTADSTPNTFCHAHIHRIGMSSKAFTAEEITSRFNFFKDRFNITEESA